MLIVDAVWEKRNLGVEACEITIESGDTADYVSSVLSDIRKEYCVIKVPAERTDLLFDIQRCGYTYVEDSVKFVSYLSEVRRSPIEQRLYDAVDIALMDQSDMALLKQKIADGLFDKDRVYIDPFFDHASAAKRYINWIDDEFRKGAEFIKYIYKNNTIGFFAIRESEEKKYTSFLGGIYPEYRKGGIGTVVKVPEAVKARGGISVSTHVSTNNPAQIRNLIRNGYVIEDIAHTFVKHNIL
ncbi:MAG: hypothetical protein IJZ95_09380 [Oscillospiraceae bacterium]|nr:hypothetical protein [Oscillospiraceae bacterium]